MLEKFRAQKVFLRWLLIFSLTVLGVTGAYISGIVDSIIQADVTKISIMIFLLFSFFSAQAGVRTFRLANQRQHKEDLKDMCRKTETGWFASDVFLTMGMIGTVIGFIYMLSASFADLSVTDVTTMQRALATIGKGMSTALYTTAVGLVCSLLLKVQLFNLSQHLDATSEDVSCGLKDEILS